MSYGITVTGYVTKTLEQIKADMVTALRAVFGAAFNPELRPMKELIGIFAERHASLWELGEDAYAVIDRANATGAMLDAIGALTGTLRRAATKSTVPVTVNLDAATTLPAGSIAAVSGNPDARFVLLADVTSTTAGNYAAQFEAEDTGPVAAPSGTLTVIVSAVTGWNSVTNATDAVLGVDVESDADYRARQVRELSGPGGSTVDGIAADVSAVDGVTYARVYENTSLTTDGDGLPGKSFETVHLGGANADVAQAIWDSKPAGIESHGTTTTNVTDDAGRTQAVKHTPATPITLYIELDLYTVAVDYAGDTAVKDAVLDFTDSAYNVGNDIIASQIEAAALSVDGVIDIKSATGIDTVTPTVATGNYIIARDEIGAFDSTRISITTTEAITD